MSSGCGRVSRGISFRGMPQSDRRRYKEYVLKKLKQLIDYWGYPTFSIFVLVWVVGISSIVANIRGMF
ncbi:hypothetical protein My1_022 [Pectobacterium phage My1]|uniref:Uncharacterized protein n=1 Tax=Pectobacterium phage My1 TaxID=1204539 RepID=J9QPQ5_9CAUD|nr:hypothetical protein My1_022 [Pectobacterium phage My1]AFQ22181.1 hypothetical protein My1_022 [Pectobacterium phage My1]